MSRFKLTVAPNGARRQKSDHPALPVTIEEIAHTARACFDAGAHELHLHVRDGMGRHSLDDGRYREAIAAVTETAPKMSIQITTESGGIYGVEEQFACLAALRPLAASIAVREMVRDPEIAARIYALTKETGTKVQHIIYSPECVNRLFAWHSEGIISLSQDDAIFVLGQYDPPVLARPFDLDRVLLATTGHGLRWSICAFGRHEQRCLLRAIQLGGNARIGFENNIETPDGKLLQDNAASVMALVSAVKQTSSGL